MNVLITGCNRGIGLELCKAYLSDGHHVAATCRNLKNSPELQTLAADFSKTLKIYELDVINAQSLTVLETYDKPLDLLINNAGILTGYSDTLQELQPEDLMKMYDVNVMGPLRVIQKLQPSLQKSKTPVIATISSKVGSIADNSSGGAYGYRISKTAVNMFNKSLSHELKNTVCVVLHPGWVQTEMGGEAAPTTTQESAQGLKHVISELKLSDSGSFFDFQGKSLPW